MKPLFKLALAAFLFLFCLLAALPATAAPDEEAYVLMAVFAGADMGSEERAPSITIMIDDGSEVNLLVTEETLFFGTGEATLEQFIELFVGQQVNIEFVVRDDEYFVLECWLILQM